MAIDTMKKGSIEMLTLFLLCEEDTYGYQLVQKIKERRFNHSAGGVILSASVSLGRRWVHHRSGDRNTHEHGALPYACDLSY